MVEIMLENHTFDDLFATFPGADGIPAGTALPAPGTPGGFVAPFAAPPFEGEVQAGMDNSRASELVAMDRRRGVGTGPTPLPPGRPAGAAWAMDRFVLVPGSGLSAITTFPPRVDPDLQALARAGELADDNFQPVIGPSLPNVLEALAGTAHGNTTNDIPAGTAPWPSIFEQLAAAGLSSQIYAGVPASIFAGTVWPALLPTGATIASTTRFLGDLGAGRLPDFSFVRPGVGYSEEPPEDVGEGDLWLGQLLAAIEASPDWPSTAVFVTYDEGGGFYDHVSPPLASPFGDGTRTPMVIVSPYARHGVYHARTTNLSILAFVEHLFGLAPLDRLVAQQNDLAGAFDLARVPLPAPPLPVAPPASLEAYGSPDRLHDLAAFSAGRPSSFLLESNTPGLALDPLSGPVALAVTAPPGAADPLPAAVVLVRGVATVPVSAARPGYYRVRATGPRGSLGEITLDVSVTPATR